ncbi:MAG: NADH-quinone oxidoreductase subunit NuoK [Elusimicrobia bacterium]|nr:NADH-quinone oxidoreductase subunit NuoK [Elusimicrobiota bacterium]MDE2424756.1 NADH-quinone oxidoreductase subunit NuoK [Elusimicrobiota bacterium]
MTALIYSTTILLFFLGLAAVVLRRQLLAMLLGLELMVSAVNVSLVYLAGLFSDAQALAAVLIIIAVAAAEAVVGLTLIIDLREQGREADCSALRELKG